MTRKRKLWLAGGFLVAAIAGLVFASMDRSPCSFLNRFNPRRAVLVQIGPNTFVVTRHGRLRLEDRVSMLIFQESDANAVRAALDKHFSLTHSCVAHQVDSSGAFYKNGMDEIREYGATSSSDWVFDYLQADATAQFYQGPQAAFLAYRAEHPSEGEDRAKAVGQRERGCIVLIPRHPSWVENAIDGVRGWLHL